MGVTYFVHRRERTLGRIVRERIGNQYSMVECNERPNCPRLMMTTGLLIVRIFRCTPLHDYGFACWIAVWFVFWCRPEGATDEEMRRARNAVYKNHCTTFGADAIRTACWLLPGMLRPLGITLVEMRDTLAVAYLVFETSFDGSKILPVYRGVRYLFYLF